MTAQDVHLLILIHGMWGSPSNLASMHRIMKEIRLNDSSVDPDGKALHIMLAETNQAESTYDGIDWGGERVATEVSLVVPFLSGSVSKRLFQVFEEIEKLEKEGKRVTRFSVTGYSLGGLLGRYLVGYVFSLFCPHYLTLPCTLNSILHRRKFFATVTPVNFNTVATPHVGLLPYPSLLSRLGSVLGPRLLGRTGKQLYTVDKWSKTGKPLLAVMADPGMVIFHH